MNLITSIVLLVGPFVVYGENLLSKGTVICDKEAYNCPSYRGKYIDKRLKSCDEVKLVWRQCGLKDPHDLDRDKGWDLYTKRISINSF